MSDDELLSADGPVAWPLNGDFGSKDRVMSRVRECEPSLAQADVLREAITREEDSSWTILLIGQILRHEGREEERNDLRYYQAEDIDRVYEAALAMATSVNTRIAIHRGRAAYGTSYSIDDLRRGIRSPKEARLFEHKLWETKDAREQRALIEILRGISGSDQEDLLRYANRWLTNSDRAPSEAEIEEWTLIVCNKLKQHGSHTADGIRADAAKTLARVLPRLEGQTLRSALGLLCGLLFDEHTCEPLLLEYIRHELPEVRAVCTDGFAQLKQAQVLRDVLANDPARTVLDAAWNALDKTTSFADRTRIIATNANTDVAASVVLSKLLHSGNSDREDVLQQVWPSLPAHFRDALERVYRQEPHRDFFHHPGLWHEWREWLRLAPSESLVGTAILSWITRPLHEQLDAYDLESVTCLRRVDHVEMRDEEVLRFAFLAEQGILSDRRLRWQLEQFDFDYLLEQEKEYDVGRDRLAGLRQELAGAAAELGQQGLDEVRRTQREGRGERGSDETTRLSQSARQFVEIERALKHLQSQNNERWTWRVRDASKKILPLLREMNVPMTGMLAPDGILGEYQPLDRSVTLFGPMIELAALDVARELGCSLTEVWPIVRSIVEIHELAHAQMHLGHDATGRGWQSPDAATIGFHEAFAQIYTRKVVAKLKVEHAAEVLQLMEQWLPDEYRYADLLAEFDPEELRSYVVRRRTRVPARTQADVLLGALRGLDGLLRSLFRFVHGKGKLPEEAIRLRALKVHEALVMTSNVIESQTATRVSAIDALLDVIHGLPQAEDVLGAFVKGGWPSNDERRLLLFEALVVGEPIGKGPLRYLRKKDIIKAVSTSKSAAEIGLKPALRMSEEAVAELCKFAGRDPNDEHFGVRRAPKKKPKTK